MIFQPVLGENTLYVEGLYTLQSMGVDEQWLWTRLVLLSTGDSVVCSARDDGPWNYSRLPPIR